MPRRAENHTEKEEEILLQELYSQRAGPEKTEGRLPRAIRRVPRGASLPHSRGKGEKN